MANTKNLKKGGITTETASEMGKKGAAKSAESRRNKKLLKDCLEILLDKMMDGEDGDKITGSEAISTSLFKRALEGDTKAFEIIRDTIGQKPVDKVQATQTVVDMSKFSTEEIKAMLDDDIP